MTDREREREREKERERERGREREGERGRGREREKREGFTNKHKIDVFSGNTPTQTLCDSVNLSFIPTKRV